MSVIERLASDVAADMAQTDKIKVFAIDPFTIGIIVNVITELVKLYMQCRKTPQDTAASMQDPGLIERWRLRRVIRQHVDDDEAHAHLGGNLFKSTLNVAKSVSEVEVEAMFEEVK